MLSKDNTDKDKVKYVFIPSKVTALKSGAYSPCTKITDVYINNTFMGEHSWKNGWYVSANSAIDSITISGNNAQFTTTTASIRNIRIVGFNDLAAAQAYNG